MTSGPRLRLARQARGFSQQQLAGMAGISRQAVSAVESGQSDPSLRVALALAGALGLSVDELFGHQESTVQPVSAHRVAAPADGSDSPGARVTLASVGGSFVAFPLSGATVSRAGFLPAGGLVVADQEAHGKAAVRPIGPPRPTLVVAGCDPALPLLAEPLSLLDPPIAFSWWPCSSAEALRLAAGSLVHAAGVHLRDPFGGYNTASAGELLPGGGEVVGFTQWQEGLVLRRDAGDRISDLGDVVGMGLRLVNREPGAEARRVLDRELAGLGVPGAQVPGYATTATGHLQVAEAIAAGLADAGVACEPAALAYGLAFVPMASERFDLVIPAALAGSREVQALTKVLTSRWLVDQLASLPGYDPSTCGQPIASLPGAVRHG